MKIAAYIAGLLGLALLTVLIVHADVPAMLRIWKLAGAALLWLVPYRLVYFTFYALGWRALLRCFDTDNRVGLGYMIWVATVREGVDRLLPVANLGGNVVGARLIRWRGIELVPIAATIIAEILVTLFAVYIFGALGAAILIDVTGSDGHRNVLAVLGLSLPIPVGALLLLRYGAVFQRLERFIGPMVGLASADIGAALDAALRACLAHVWTLISAGAFEFAALLCASLEIWWALRLFDHPVSVPAAVMLEGLMQAVRHLAFIVPAGIGVQEGALVLFGQALGISTELALSVSAVKRMREVLCGVPALLAWQWAEAHHLRKASDR